MNHLETLRALWAKLDRNSCDPDIGLGDVWDAILQVAVEADTRDLESKVKYTLAFLALKGPSKVESIPGTWPNPTNEVLQGSEEVWHNYVKESEAAEIAYVQKLEALGLVVREGDLIRAV